MDKNNGERKKKRENKNTCEYERESCFKSYQKMVVQISFLIIKTLRSNSKKVNHNNSYEIYNFNDFFWLHFLMIKLPIKKD